MHFSEFGLVEGSRSATLLRAAAVGFVLATAAACGAQSKTAETSSDEGSGSAATSESQTSESSPKVEAEEFCDQLCTRAKTCDEDFDRQTCQRSCKGESGVIGNLSPHLMGGLYECVETASCATIGTLHFTADCLALSASEQQPTAAGKTFCAQLANGADECNFTDFEERACWQVSVAFSDDTLRNAAICTEKKCALIVPCLDATLQLPSELDGTPIGFDAELSSGQTAVPASHHILPATASGTDASSSFSGAESDSTASAQSRPESSDGQSPIHSDSTDGQRSSVDAPATAASSPASSTSSGENSDTTRDASAPMSWESGASTDPSAPTESSSATSSTTTGQTSTTSTSTTSSTTGESTSPPETEPPPSCDECLELTCDAEANACLDDQGCLDLVGYVGACDDLDAEGEIPFDECFSIAVDIVAEESPSSLYVFDDWLSCMEDAQAACGCE